MAFPLKSGSCVLSQGGAEAQPGRSRDTAPEPEGAAASGAGALKEEMDGFSGRMRRGLVTSS